MDDWSFCPKCGSKLDDGDAVCGNCGSAMPSPRTVESSEEPFAPDEAQLAALTAELREVLAPNLQLLRQLGQGGMGTVFLARDPLLKRHVAVKVLAPGLAQDPGAKARFQREAQAVARLSHPNIVAIYSVSELADGTLSLPFFHPQLSDWILRASPQRCCMPRC